MEEIYSRYFDPALSLDDRKKLLQEIENDSVMKKEFQSLLKAWSLSSFSQQNITDLNLGKEYANLSESLDKQPSNNITLSEQRVISLKVLYRYVAFIILLLGTGILSYVYLKQKEVIGYNEITTKTGEKVQIRLSDGTKIWLNASSKLRYPSKLDGNQVHVYLQGEAYFDVAHLNKRLFQVHASDLNIKVLGTAFNVKSYPEDHTVETTLVRGKIRIEGQSEDSRDYVILMPNQKASYFGKNSKLIVTESNNKNTLDRSDDIPQLKEIVAKTNATVVLSNNVNTKFETSWKDGKLEFVDEQFSLLAVKMERWFGVQIKISDETLMSVRYTGTFEKESVEQALKALSMSLPFKYKIYKDTVIIQK